MYEEEMQNQQAQQVQGNDDVLQEDQDEENTEIETEIETELESEQENENS